AASHYGPHLVCVGDGPEREALKRKFAMLGVASRVHLPGRVPHADVPVWIGGADAAVAPYPAVEGFYFSPLKIYEFMALGLPIVASAIGQVRDIVPDGERGFLYPPGNAAALAATISRVITDHAEAERRAENARAWVLEHATWNVRVREILERIAALS
ncbi:MAG: glycosyltransferase family 4 protein, partial [Planctomycetes bacterium]|nr:glycosyltransferase family 4 protein [Planctomycetota bacterium]